MGNEQSFATSKALTGKNLRKIRKAILKEYPRLSNLDESVLITDKTMEDNPIVFANERFTDLLAMTKLK